MPVFDTSILKCPVTSERLNIVGIEKARALGQIR
jgi:hypothetical protein